ncbi:SAM-dependent methyltransferase [Marinobacterium lacunae]|uniref:SAM-dependent methyltransferase n=1 Tax=Marinobacterium lacunae TaxID=1232683 RepID=A0A081G021_9GAMM|nr:histidine kinase [Marinobacterium lacunae]KEA64126.1 SAM-dependent methyltransferase [Marinobacterium lacunae]MBR9885827.1 histidine kinase [Oceanospirillales bacterium]
MPSLRLRYQTLEIGGHDIHLRTLRDNQQFSDKEGVAEGLGISSATWPIFGIVWASGQVLAHHMIDYEIKGKRILEVGCGIGLSSLLLNQRNADISATDYHPEAGGFLTENVRINGGRTIPFTRTGWGDDADGMGLFDIIIGSDLLYEAEHASLLSEFIDRHAHHYCEVIIVDPGRGNQNRFSKAMDSLGYALNKTRPEHTDYLDAPYKGNILHYQRPQAST